MTDELLREFRRSVLVNVKLSLRVTQLEARIEAMEKTPKLDQDKVNALEKKIDEVILSMKVRR